MTVPPKPIKTYSPTQPVTELHRHLDVSVRISTLYRLACERGLESQSTSLERFKERIFLKKPLLDLGQVLAKFELFQMVLDRPEVLAQITFEAIEDLINEGIEVSELRFSPSFICQLSKLSWQDALDGILLGVENAKKTLAPINIGFLCIASRDYGPESVEKTIEFYLKNQHSFLGIDLAGDETRFSNSLFSNAFKKAKKAGARITIHAGEALGPESVWEALELFEAERIGHGIHCIKDPELVQNLAQKKIALEVCPTSNWLTQSVAHLNKHPLKELLQAGIPVCLNTDDPGVFDVTLLDEVKIATQTLGLTERQIQLCFANAWKSSFLNPENPPI